MPSEITTVLLVPEEGDPLGLLAEGPCGARPPVAYEWQAVKKWRTYDGPLPPPERRRPYWRGALVLAWDGEPVAEGLDRAGRRAQGFSCPYNDAQLSIAVVLRFRAMWETLGALILLDADGREVTR